MGRILGAVLDFGVGAGFVIYTLWAVLASGPLEIAFWIVLTGTWWSMLRYAYRPCGQPESEVHIG